LEERLSTVQKELQALEEHLKEQADYKKQYEELKVETDSRLTKAEALTSTLRNQVESLQEDLTDLTSESRAKAEQQLEELQELQKRHEAEKGVLLEKLAEANASRLAFKNLLRPVVTELIEEQFKDALKEADQELVKELKEAFTKELREVAGQVKEYKATRTVADLTLEVERQPLVIDAKTTRGQVLALITDGFFNRPTTIPKILKELQSQFVDIKREQLEPELAWYVQESVLHHTVLATGAHVYQLRADAKDRVRKVVKEAPTT